MKCRVEYTHHRHIRHDLPAGVYADQIRRVMKRRQIVALLDHCQNLVIQHHRTGKPLAAVYDTVSNRINLLQRSDHTHLRIRQLLDHQLHRFRVIRHIYLALYLLTARRLMYDRTSVNPDPLT